MNMTHNRGDYLFLFICFMLAYLADLSFMQGRIGLSYLVFISVFYLVIFIRFRFTFNHRRIGLLLSAVIWLLSSTFLLYDNEFFLQINVILIPLLVLIHLVLITQPNTFVWETPHFIQIVLKKLSRAVTYNKTFIVRIFKRVTEGRSEKKVQLLYRVFVGCLIAFPILSVVIVLLMKADDVFYKLVWDLPQFMLNVNLGETIFRMIFIVFVGFLFFGIIQLLAKERNLTEVKEHTVKQKAFSLDSVTVMTVLILLNTVYLFFLAIQFPYILSDKLMDGLTYAEFARKGFYELLTVVVINWTILFITLRRTTYRTKQLKLVTKVLYSLLIGLSTVLLVSAFSRLSLYESIYGFTLARFMAHAFMIYLFVIFAYTFMRVWLERLALLHFYVIFGLIFYTGLNMMNVNQFIVDQNIERFKETEDIDAEYLASLSFTGWTGLVEIDQLVDDPVVKAELEMSKCLVQHDYYKNWQSYNFARERFVNLVEETYGPDGLACQTEDD